MSSNWGRNIHFSLFGESHGAGIGGVLDGLAPGIELDLEALRFEMARRATGQSDLTTPRKEPDEVEILSGYFEGRTTGTPLAFLIRNTNTKSRDYQPELLRPGHADYTGKVKYLSYNDYRGGGHFSGRLTAPLVFAGGIAGQMLENMGIYTAAHIASIQDVCDTPFNPLEIDFETACALKSKHVPTLDAAAAEAMEQRILAARSKADSVGGVIECAILNVPEGLGGPFFESFESELSRMLFSVPGVKGVEFGTGFGITALTGSQANDAFYTDGESIKTKTNHNGGINGGITNGMPIVFRVAMKPTPSIGAVQNTVNIDTMENTQIAVKGRHDPCIVVRAVPVIEAAAKLATLDISLSR